MQYTSQKLSTLGQDLYELIKALPSSTYGDSADVAVALGELKSRKEIRSEEEVEATEQPGSKGGRTAATSSIYLQPLLLKFIRHGFFKEKRQLKAYAKKNVSNVQVGDPNGILNVIDKLPDREYNSMADVERSIGSII